MTLSEDWYEAAQEWVDAEAAADLLESTKSSVLAQKVLALGDMAVNKAEAQVKGSQGWLEILEEIAAARANANQKKIAMEFKRMQFQEHMSKEANARTEARL